MTEQKPSQKTLKPNLIENIYGFSVGGIVGGVVGETFNKAALSVTDVPAAGIVAGVILGGIVGYASFHTTRHGAVYTKIFRKKKAEHTRKPPVI